MEKSNIQVIDYTGDEALEAVIEISKPYNRFGDKLEGGTAEFKMSLLDMLQFTLDELEGTDDKENKVKKLLIKALFGTNNLFVGDMMRIVSAVDPYKIDYTDAKEWEPIAQIMVEKLPAHTIAELFKKVANQSEFEWISEEMNK